MYKFKRVFDGRIEVSTENTTDIVREDEIIEGDSLELSTAFADFKSSPKYLVGQKVCVDFNDLENLKEVYKQLLLGCCLLRAESAGRTEEQGHREYERAVDWLEKTDFFVGPGSSQYHDSHKGGLLQHTITVYNQIPEVWKIDKFNKINICDAALCGLVHDWCKIGLYESYKRNVKNENTGKWESVDAYKRAEPKFPVGHGDASMYLAGKFFRLSLEEALAIRWHMGHWYTHSCEENDLSTANKTYPLVYMIQFADQLAISYY